MNWAKDEEELRRKQQQQEEGAKQEQHQRQQNHHHEENAVVAERVGICRGNTVEKSRENFVKAVENPLTKTGGGYCKKNREKRTKGYYRKFAGKHPAERGTDEILKAPPIDAIRVIIVHFTVMCPIF